MDDLRKAITDAEQLFNEGVISVKDILTQWLKTVDVLENIAARNDLLIADRNRCKAALVQIVNLPVIATGDVYLNPEANADVFEAIREIIEQAINLQVSNGSIA